MDQDILQRQACKLVGLDPEIVRREKPPNSPEVCSEITAIASKRLRFGYPRVGVLLNDRLDDSCRKLALERYDCNNNRPHSSMETQTPAEVR